MAQAVCMFREKIEESPLVARILKIFLSFRATQGRDFLSCKRNVLKFGARAGRSRYAIRARLAVEPLFLLIKPTCSRHRCLSL